MTGDLATLLADILPEGTDPDQRREVGARLAEVFTGTIDSIVADRLLDLEIRTLLSAGMY
jgi:5-carboxymethyl-2-hydroxymuconate isomerase